MGFKVWLHPVMVLLVPTVLSCALGISVHIIYHQMYDTMLDWPRLTSGSIWLGLFAGGILGTLFNLVSAIRMKQTTIYPYPGRFLNSISNIEYAKLKQWIRAGTVTSGTLKDIKGKS